jgi:hypothetical protein
MLLSEIYENKYDQKTFSQARDEVNTKEERERADFYISKYRQLKTEIQPMLEEWERIEKLYRCEREKKSENDPNSFDPIILPVVEGQTAAMGEKNISASVKGEGYSDQRFAHTGQILTDYAYRHIRIKSKVKQGIRRYVLNGTGCFAIGWNADALDGFGLPDWRTPQVSKVFVDGKIKNLMDVEKAEYIIEEIGSFSILSARKEYGDEIAEAVSLGNTDPDFDADNSMDDKDSFTKLHVWTRNNDEGNLQRLEISLCGVMLEESDPAKPFYEHVENQYPYKFFGLYPQEGRFHRFGDGKLLEKLQILLNNLWDECVIAAKYSAQAELYADPDAGLDPDQRDGDPSHPIFVREPTKNVHTVQGQGINQVIFTIINLILNEIQRITRFSTLMMGSAPGREITATQSGIMVQQGNSGVDDKRGDVSEAIAESTMYMLGLMMEFWPAGKAIRITEESDDIEWVDARNLKSIPAMIPTDTEFENKWRAVNPTKPVPKFMQLETEGKPQTKKAMFDIEVSIGEGLPTNKLALLNVILSLSKMILPDEVTGQPRSLLSYQQVQKIIEDVIGIPIMKLMPEAEKIVGAPTGAMGGSVNQNLTANTQQAGNPYIEGAGGADGLMSNQPMGG